MSLSHTANSPRTLRFVLDGSVVSLPEPPPTMTVLEFLRDVSGRRGTKEGCAEGDCGACAVVIGELAGDPCRVRYRAVNSCIRFLPTLDGKELVTVESLEQPAGAAAHPVQQSLVDHHGSQCGFCTPGFVMSLLALYLNRTAADRQEVQNALSGNLCRCTGYRPIIEAGMRQHDYPPPEHWSREEAGSVSHVEALRSIARAPDGKSSLRYPGFHAPRGLDELAAALEAGPESVLLAGGTDVGLLVTKQMRELPALLYLGGVPELAAIEQRAEELWIGAAVALTDAWPALLAQFPGLAEQAMRFASPPIRNSATLCGNLANGSPIGDAIQMLIALDARLELRQGTKTRRLPLEDFYLGYGKKDLAMGEYISGVAIPRAHAGQLLASYKLSKRFDQDISAVAATFCVTVEAARVTEARLAYGGMADVPRRARHAERALRDGGWTESGIEAAMAALATDFKPLTDLRASREYRLTAAANLLRRFYLQQQGEHVMRTTDAVSDLG